MNKIENIELVLPLAKIIDNKLVISKPSEINFEKEDLPESKEEPCEDNINPDKRKEVEEAAIKTVIQGYKNDKWEVDEHPQKLRHIGYDLECTRGNLIEHAEVKGRQGNDEIFYLHASEEKASKEDDYFVIWIVTSALSKMPTPHKYTKDNFHEHFNYEPSTYYVTPKLKRN